MKVREARWPPAVKRCLEWSFAIGRLALSSPVFGPNAIRQRLGQRKVACVWLLRVRGGFFEC